MNTECECRTCYYVFGFPPIIEKEEKTEKEIKKNKASAKRKEKNKYKTEFNHIRPLILKRDNFKCVKCCGNEGLSVHHIVQRSKGGTNDIDNLITLCSICHTKTHENEMVHTLMKSRL